MRGYVIQRILAFVPTLLLISVLIFFLRESVPGNRASDLLVAEQDRNIDNSQSTLDDYRQEAARLHLDLPSFYFSVHPRGHSTTLPGIYLPERREWYKKALMQRAALENIAQLETELTQILAACESEQCLQYRLHRYDGSTPLPRSAKIQLSESASLTLDRLDTHTLSVSDIIPRVTWHGTDSRYHLWISSLLSDDTIRSRRDGRPARLLIAAAARWTLAVALSSLLCGAVLAILLAIYLHRYESRWHARILQQVLRAIYATPLFWGATLSIIFLTTSYYSEWLDWFPAAGIFPLLSPEMSWWQRLSSTAPSLALPILLLTIYSLPYLVDQLRQSLHLQSSMAYAMTARAKGLTEKRILWRHTLPNSLLSFLTILGGRVAGLLSGSLIVEILFGIPGMGKLLYDSILGRDWDIVMVVALLSAIITMLAYLLTDIAYTLAHPQIVWKS